MAGSGATASFLRKRFTQGDRVGCTMSIVVSAATFDISKSHHGIKAIDYFTYTPKSLTTGGVIFRQNLTGATTVLYGNLSGSGFTTGDELVCTVFGV